jgi:uncharacterized protein (TIGR04255 family)
MHLKLSKQPVTYVLAQVKFSNIEEIGNSVPRLQEEIRHLFPHFQEINTQLIQVSLGQQANLVTGIQWHFIDKAKETGIILDKQSLTIHTSNHQQFQILLDSFENVIEKFHKILNFSLATRLGLRYINIIKIKEYIDQIDTRLQGFLLEGGEFEASNFLTTAETIQRSKAGTMKISATRIANKKFIPNIQNIFVPPDLVNNANLLSFKHHSEPEQEFLVLDMDHFNAEQSDFNVKTISSHLQTLQEIIYKAFRQAVGEKNLNNWK